MKSLDLKSFYAQPPGMSSPCKVTVVIFNGQHRVVTVFVGCASGVAWADPETGKRAEIRDWQKRTWRHLGTRQFQTIMTARVPRLLLKNGKSITARVPLAQRGARVTRALDSHAIGAQLNCRTVRASSRLTGLGEDQLDGIMARAVRDGLARRATPMPKFQRQDLRTAGAWALKENFRRIWSYRSVAGAMRFAHDWAEAVAHAGLRPMIKAAKTVKRHL